MFAATLDTLREHGLAGISFNGVAATAGINRSTLYRRWPDRSELVLAAILDSIEEKIVPADLGSLEAEMRSILEQIASYLNSPLGHAVLIAGLELGGRDGASSPRPGLWYQRLLDLDPIFERAVTRGEIEPDFDREVALAMADGPLYTRTILHNRPIDAEWIDRIMALWSGLPRRSARVAYR